MAPQRNKIEEGTDPTELDGAQDSSTRELDQTPASKPEESKSLFSSLREAYERARDGQKRPQPEKQQSRTAKSVDRSKGLLILAAAVIVMIFVFLGMFSSSSTVKERAGNRNKPSLGRPNIPANNSAEGRGSVAPLLNADVSGQDGNSDQLSKAPIPWPTFRPWTRRSRPTAGRWPATLCRNLRRWSRVLQFPRPLWRFTMTRIR